MKILWLACLAAVNPQLLAVDLLLPGNRRPRLMFGRGGARAAAETRPGALLLG